jgi:hypothetical protein
MWKKRKKKKKDILSRPHLTLEYKPALRFSFVSRREQQKKVESCEGNTCMQERWSTVLKLSPPNYLSIYQLTLATFQVAPP